MRLKAESRGSGGGDGGLIPMINIVFLLLVFFMLAGTVRPADPFDTEPPASSREGELPSAARLLHLGSDGVLALDGELIERAELARLLAPLRSGADTDRSSRATVAATDIEDDGLLALQADANVPFALLRETIDALRSAGVQRVELVTVPVATAAP